MSVNLIFKIAAVGILVSVLGQVLKHSGREEQAFLTSLAGPVSYTHLDVYKRQAAMSGKNFGREIWKL